MTPRASKVDLGRLWPFRSCPAGWKLTRAAAQGPDWKLARHLSRCARCSADLESLRVLVQDAAAAMPGLADSAADGGLSPTSRELIATRLMSSASGPERTAARPAPPFAAALRWAAAAGGLAAAGIALAVWWPRAAPERAPAASAASGAGARSPATIRAFGDARFSRKQGPPDEIVELGEGTIDVDVTPLAPGARFRVVAMNGGEVEVRGTSFRVSAPGGRLAEVHVWRGHVEVRSFAGAVTQLVAGDSWSAEPTPALAAVGAPAAAPLAASPAPVRSRGRTRIHETIGPLAHQAPSPPDPAPEAPPAEAPPPPSFHRGWSLLRGGNAIAAAEAFAEVQDASRGTNLEADALYWRAVALSRGGQKRTARDLFELFLARFPSSSRAGEAAVALGYLLLDLGQLVEAERAFARGERDPSERVRASARLGLQQLSP